MASSLGTKSLKLLGMNVVGCCDEEEKEEKRKGEGAAIRRMGGWWLSAIACQQGGLGYWRKLMVCGDALCLA